MFDRQIRRRVAKIAPFLVLDEDPYPVVSDGRIFWIQDAYTVSDRYPYLDVARRRELHPQLGEGGDRCVPGLGHVLSAETSDPIAQTLTRIFPDLMRPLSEMPADLRQHVRYPEDIFQLQASVYATYHMTNPAVFYNKEDQWEAPAVDSSGESSRMSPYYTMMKLPGEQDAEFIQMLPFTPRRRDNLASWMVARSDGDNYGKLQVFQFPKQTLVFGPQQVVARINQDQVISPQITLWSQQGSQVIQGTLMVIPIEESLIYVRPLYLRAQTGRIPELTRVIVAYQNRIVMEPTLDQAIARLFGQSRSRCRAAARPPAAPPPRRPRPPPRRHQDSMRPPGSASPPRPETPISARSRRKGGRLGGVRRRDSAPGRAARADAGEVLSQSAVDSRQLRVQLAVFSHQSTLSHQSATASYHACAPFSHGQSILHVLDDRRVNGREFVGLLFQSQGTNARGIGKRAHADLLQARL